MIGLGFKLGFVPILHFPLLVFVPRSKIPVLVIYAVTARLDVKVPNFTCHGGLKQRPLNFLSLSELGYGSQEFNYSRVRLH